MRPARLSEKLTRIRYQLGLSQDDMLERLNLKDVRGFFRSSISAYELGSREPPLPVLLEYARVANVYVDVLIDDKLSFTQEIPADPKSEGVPEGSPLEGKFFQKFELERKPKRKRS
jgi:transcriptional regulator with XRE-family HTH domain